MHGMRIGSDLWFDGDRLRKEPVTLEVLGPTIIALREGPIGEVEVDARGKLLMPGMVDAHAHVARAGFYEPDEPPLQLAQIVANFQGALRAGVTTVADMGCTIPMLRRLRALTEHDPLAGPRFMGAGPMISAPEGYPFVWISKLWRHAEAALAVASPREAARAVSRTVDGGMDHIKIAVMHESFARSPIPALSVSSAKAVVDEAHRLGRRVYAHAHSTADYTVALDAGVDALMHSSFEPLPLDLLKRIRDAGICMTPTLWAYDSTCQVGRCKVHQRPEVQRHATERLRQSWRRFADAYDASGDVFPDHSIVRGVRKSDAEEAMRISATNLRLLHDAGVPIAFGSDSTIGVSMLSRPIDELTAMHNAGLDAPAVLRAATGAAADLLGIPTIGRIRAGASADFVIADASLVHSVAALDVDRPGVTLDVIARGRRVPPQTSSQTRRAIGAAVVAGTAATLGHTLGSLARSLVDGEKRRRPTRNSD